MENVLTVPARLVRPYLRGNGLLRGVENELYALVEKEHVFIPRDKAETDPTYKQIIPYIMLWRGDEVFCTRRLKKGGEARLHDRLSLGIGGHINSGDGDTGSIFENGLRRELAEEVSTVGAKSLVPVGVINDDSNTVGQVHLGFFFTLEVEDAQVLETEKLTGFWLRRDELPTVRERMESWSQVVIDALL